MVTENKRSDAVRTDPFMLDSNGKILWKLGSYNSSSNIILQDIGSWDSIELRDKWFIYNEEEEAAAKKYISSLRNPRLIRHHPDDAEEGAKSDSSDCPDSKYCLPQADMGV